MKKEEVIIFEGEHNFVVPKNRVRNKKTGVSYYVPEEMNVTAPVGVGVLEPPIEPPKQPDEPIGSPKTITTQQEDATTPTPVPTGVTLASKGTLSQNDAVSLGGAKLLPSAGEESGENLTTTTTNIPTQVIIPTLPIGMGVSPSKLSGGGGGGGGSKDSATPKKTLLQKYWWVLLIVAVGGGYYYYKNKKK